MKVLLMLSSIAMGGAERNIVSVVPYFQKAGIEILLCTLNKRRDSPLAEIFAASGVERFDLGARRMTDIKAIRKFGAFLHDRKIDIVHAEDQDTIIYAGLSRRMFHVPSLMTRHVLQEPVTSWKTYLRSRMVFWSARFGVNAIVAVSEEVRRQFSKQAHVPLEKIHTIHNGIEFEKFRLNTDKSKLREMLGWDARRPTAVFVSVLRPGKGFEVLLGAIPIIKRSLPDFVVKIVGGGELEMDLKRQFAPLGEAVEFLGQRMDIPQILSASDVLIQASWSEALPTVLIEAGAAAIPVVATRVGGTEEIVHHGKSGYVIEPGDSGALAERVIEILKSPILQKQMGVAASSFIQKNFSLELQVEQTISLYKKIIYRKS